MSESSTRSLSPGPCPDLEDLAALADGSLEGEERENLLLHLADCPQCYEVFEETVALMEELAEEAVLVPEPETHGNEPSSVSAESTRVLPFEPHSRRWPAAAAMALAAVAALVLVLRPSAPTPFSIRAATSVLAAAGPPSEVWGKDWAIPPWPAYRSGELPSEIRVREFQIGAETVSLQLALAGRETVQARRSLRRLEGILEGTWASPMAHRYSELGDEMDTAEDVALFSERAAELALELPSFLVDRKSFEVGAWAMAGWLASRAKLDGYFKEKSHRIPWPADALDPSLAESVLRVEMLLASGSPENFELLTQGFEDLLVVGGRS